MRRILSFLPLLVLIVFFACNRDGQDNRRKHVTNYLSGQVMAIEDLEGYRLVASYQDYLFLQEARDTSRLVVYRIEGDTLKRVTGLINRGRGPREFLYANFSLAGDSLFVSNADPYGIKAIVGVSLADMRKIDDSEKWKEYIIPKSNILTMHSFAGYGPGRFFLAAGKVNTREIFSLLDPASGEYTPLSWYPCDSTEGPLFAKQRVYMQCSLCTQGDRVCYAHSYARYLFFATVADGALVVKNVVYSSLPEYEIESDGNVSYGPEGENGIELASTSEYVFAQIGRTRKEIRASELYKGYHRDSFDEIEVYNWDGEFVANYQLDRPVNSFVVSSDNHYLYAFTEDPESAENYVVRYELPL